MKIVSYRKCSNFSVFFTSMAFLVVSASFLRNKGNMHDQYFSSKWYIALYEIIHLRRKLLTSQPIHNVICINTFVPYLSKWNMPVKKQNIRSTIASRIDSRQITYNTFYCLNIYQDY